MTDIIDGFIEKKTKIDRSLSYSRISDFAKNGPSVLISRSRAHSLAMSIGQVTDDFLNENINIRDKYYIFNGSKPTATLGKLCNVVIDYFREIPTKNQVKEIVKKNNYWGNIKDEKLLEKKWNVPEFWDYIKVMIKGKKKEIITSEIYDKAQTLATVIKTHPNTRDEFSNKYQRIYQYPFVIKIKKVVFKGIIDYVKVDHKNKTVQFIDFKTGKDPALYFTDTFINMRYFIQEAVYMKAFKYFCKEYKLKDYKALPFKFIYVCKSEMVPLCWDVPNEWHVAALKGFTTKRGYTYRGLYQLIDEVVWHFRHRVFDMPKELYESKGKLTLKTELLV